MDLVITLFLGALTLTTGPNLQKQRKVFLHPDLLNVTFSRGAITSLKDGATVEVLDDLYSGYVSAVDNTTAILAEPLYKAYPDAKFILVSGFVWRQILEFLSSFTDG